MRSPGGQCAYLSGSRPQKKSDVLGDASFAAAPLSVILGLSIFALSLGALGTVFIDRYRRLAEVFAAGAFGGGAGG